MKTTRKNNFDKSSTGTDIEISCFRDTDLSRMYFEEEIEILQHSGYSTTSVGYFNGQGDKSDTVKMTLKGTTAAILAAARHYTSAYSDIVAASGDELEEVKAEIIGQFEDIDLIHYALDRLPEIEGLEIVPNKNIIVLTTRGYSQGDYAKVMYCPEDLEKCWGNYPKQESIQEQVNHLYWDAPIYCRFTINGTEYIYDDMPEADMYDFKREKFIQYVAKESGIKAETLESFVPEYPDYN